ncbi:aminotransferase class III-fold pyridoxal phosphate-dependent enzyme, partial [Stenotrophomonas maltophilia group sp. RNC7]|uniref:aminotransferase class III-fold pyridoxal phosphate-dependent enzyme n=1 Tax=Stenotrophomonas maltophilia group sp. RNC7 TaxID=3071467 RepID=UPI0027DF3972
MKTLHEQDQEYILNTYKRGNLVIERAEGSHLYDMEGNRYLDMYAGISVNNLGHDKKIVEAMVQQAS